MSTTLCQAVRKTSEILQNTFLHQHSTWKSFCPFSSSATAFQIQTVATPVIGSTVSPAALKRDVKSALDWPYTDRVLQIRTCGELYSQWRSRIPGYETAPSEGLDITVPFVHTGLDRPAAARENRPLVLVLPGAPGNYKDFSHLIPYLDKNGANVVCPVWPDMALSYESGCFWHSAQEKTHLLQDFLKSLRIEKIDMMVAHSSAMYPGLNILTEANMPEVKSLTLLAPAGHRIVRAIRPYPVLKPVAEYFRYPRYQRFLKELGMLIIKFTRNPIKPNMDDALMSLQAMVFSEREKAGENLKKVAQKKMPMLIAFSENDRLITASVIFKMVNMIGAANKDIWYYDFEGKLKSEGVSDSWLKVMAFEKGSHYLFHRHSNVISPAVLELLNKVTSTTPGN